MKLLPMEKKIVQDCKELDELLSRDLELVELAEAWLSLGRDYAIEMMNGLDDDESFDSVCLLLKKKTAQRSIHIAQLYYDLDQVKKSYEGLKLIDEFVIDNPVKRDYEPLFWLDEEQLDKVVEKMGFEYDDELFADANTFDKILPYMLMHALSEGGGASVDYPPDDFFEDMILDEDDKIPENHENILYCYSYIRDSKSGFGICSNCYFRK